MFGNRWTTRGLERFAVACAVLLFVIATGGPSRAQGSTPPLPELNVTAEVDAATADTISPQIQFTVTANPPFTAATDVTLTIPGDTKTLTAQFGSFGNSLGSAAIKTPFRTFSPKSDGTRTISAAIKEKQGVYTIGPQASFEKIIPKPTVSSVTIGASGKTSAATEGTESISLTVTLDSRFLPDMPDSALTFPVSVTGTATAGKDYELETTVTAKNS